MGGRGSESMGSGSSVDPNNIKNVSSLVSEREGKEVEVDEVLGVFRDFNEKYDAQIGDIRLADVVGKDRNTLGYCDGDNVGINRLYFESKKMDIIYDGSVKDGFHPSRGNKTGLEAVVAHEIGHHLTDVASHKMGMTGFGNMDGASARIMREALKLTNHKSIVKMAGKISGYAKKSNAEAVAEAVADVYCNGGNAKTESKAIVQVLESYLQ